ncbi:MAG: porin [Pseudomonadota bacterium]
MKKSFIACAVLGAIAGAAHAQSSVTVYGVADIGYKLNKDNGTDANATSQKTSGISDGALSSSRIGFRGTEDLGGGLKANFVIEQGISPTNDELFGVRASGGGHQIDGLSTSSNGGYSNGTNRQSWVGLSGNFGDVRLGYQYTNLYAVAAQAGHNPTSDSLRGAEIYHQHGQSVVGGTRANGITYISPRFSGFQATVQYGAGSAGRETSEMGGVINNNKRVGLRLNYAAGPFSADVAHTQAKFTTNTSGLATTSAFGVVAAGAQNVNTGERSGDLTQVAASYNLGVAKLSASYNTGKDGGTASSRNSSKYTSYQVGARVPVGAFALVASYGQAKIKREDTGAETLADKGYQLGLQYALSKRTTAYAYYGRSKDSGTSRSNAFAERESTVVGLAHTF